MAVCPVECIHPGEYQGQVMMIIDPDTCIDCGLCEPECPISAIVTTEDDSPDWAKINRELTPTFKGNTPVPLRPADDPPKKAGNVLR